MKWSASAQCAGRMTIGVRSAPVMVYAVNRANWKSDVLSHATVSIIFCYINRKDGRTGTNPSCSTRRRPF